jgi:precorrin-3B C17-methyltransferase
LSKLYIVGIGPGDEQNMTVAADSVLRSAEVIIGYNVYVDLVKDRYPGKEFLTTPMTKEAVRCRMALDSAASGKNTALICSGDSGVYGLAALVYELRGESTEPEIEVVPGLTAACAGGALLGAPLTHDFAVISLSDKLTPWEKIAARLECAAKGDFSIVLYNPVSKSRPDHLKKAVDILLTVLPPDRICGIARNVGRENESSRIMTLGELRDAEADMFCTVFIGNATTEKIGENMVTPRGYKNV